MVVIQMMEENRKLRAEFEKLGAVKRAVANRLASALGDLNRHKHEKEQEVYKKERLALGVRKTYDS